MEEYGEVEGADPSIGIVIAESAGRRKKVTIEVTVISQNVDYRQLACAYAEVRENGQVRIWGPSAPSVGEALRVLIVIVIVETGLTIAAFTDTSQLSLVIHIFALIGVAGLVFTPVQIIYRALRPKNTTK